MNTTGKRVTFNFTNMSKVEFDFWNHLCEIEKEVMRVEKDTINHFNYVNTEESLPEWYNDHDDTPFVEDNFTFEHEYESTFYDKNISIEEEINNYNCEVEDNMYFRSDSESEVEDNDWTTV